MDNNKQTVPAIPLGQWVPSWLTDVQRTWRKFGWLPISEQKGAR